uniref:tetratricopeptide repeat protein n=1 Tax=Prevotella sp. TaxID=59823 RepID=UPI0040261C78
MMRKRGLHILALAFAAVVCHVAAVSSVLGSKDKEAVNADTLTYEQDSLFGERFLSALRQREKGNADSSVMLIDSCLRINPRSAVAHYMRADYFADKDSVDLAFSHLETAARLAPDNDTYQERLAQMSLGMGYFDKAIDTYERLYQAHRDRDDVVAILVRLYGRQKKYDKMLDAIRRLEEMDGQSDQLLLMRMNAYEMKGDAKGAYNTLKALADSHPNDPNFKLMLGNWLMQHKRMQEAYDIYSGVLKSEPDNAMAQSCLYDYYNGSGQDALAKDMMNRLLFGKETPQETRVQFLRNAIQQNESTGGDSTNVVELFRKVQAVVPRDTTVAQLKAAYYTLRKFPKDSIDNALAQLIQLQPDNADARVQLIQDKWASQDWKEIAALSEPGMLYNPDFLPFYFFTGLSRYYLKDDKGALDALRKGTAFINDQSNTAIVAEIYSIMGEIYSANDLKKEAYAAYDSCLQYDPGNIGTLNNYAYFLSVDGVDLDRAEKMSAKVIAAEPKNATYLDTYAWILYRLGRYADAKIYIDQTLKFVSDSTSSNTLYEHAADIYAALGDYGSAASFCEKAVKQGGDAKALEKKIRLYRKKSK